MTTDTQTRGADALPVVVRSGPATGLKIVVHPSDEGLQWAGTVEPGVQSTLLTELSPGARFWDVGARSGFFTSLAARLTGPDGAVIAFEPDDHERRRLDETVRLNEAQNVQVKPWAIGSERSLDECAAELDPPDLIRIDADGAALGILEGARDLLGEHAPTLIITFHSEEELAGAWRSLTEYDFEQVGDHQWVISRRTSSEPRPSEPPVARPMGDPVAGGEPRPGLVRAIDHVPAPVVRGLGHAGPVKMALSRMVGRLVPEQDVPVVVRSGAATGLTVVIRPREERFYWAGTLEPGVQQALVDELQPGMSFWDIGAHCGFFTVIAGRQVAEEGQVVAFEPCDENRDRLNETVRLNDADNIVVVPWALGESTGEALLRELQSEQGSMKWGKVAEDPDGEAIRVPQRTLDECAEEIGPPDLVKVDVEGAELEVLEGARRIISERKTAMIIEFHDEAALLRGEGMLEGYSKRRLGRTQWLFSSR
jgi:FkbM family methyltransferase